MTLPLQHYTAARLQEVLLAAEMVHLECSAANAALMMRHAGGYICS